MLNQLRIAAVLILMLQLWPTVSAADRPNFPVILVVFILRSFLVEPFKIPSGSMIPTLLVGDYLFVSKFSYGYSRYSLPFGLPLFKGRALETPPTRGDVEQVPSQVSAQALPG